MTVVSDVIPDPAVSKPAINSGRLAPTSGLDAPDPRDGAGWTGWLQACLAGAGERIEAAQREMQQRGVLDAEGKLVEGPLPADMDPQSKSSVATG